MSDCLQLPAELTIYSVAEIRETMLAWLARQESSAPDAVEIDAGKVDDVDGAGLQLVGSLLQTLAHQGRSWRFTECSPCLREASHLLGGADLLLPLHGSGEST